MSYNKGKLTVITTDDVSKKLHVLRDMHIRKLYERMYLSYEVSGAKEVLNGVPEHLPEAICQKVSIKNDLLKFVVGHKRVNIRRARAIRGIIGMGLYMYCLIIYNGQSIINSP